MSDGKMILLAGGGTGGHIFPNLAIFCAIKAKQPDAQAHLLVSTRAVDRSIAEANQFAFTALPAQPLSLRRAARFFRAYRKSRKQTAALIRKLHPVAMIATGGFVSAPAMAAARQCGIPAVLLNLDAVPGRANQLCRRWADKQFTTFASPLLPKAETVGMPIRPEAKSNLAPAQARESLGLERDQPTLLVTAGSQGSTSINAMMAALCVSPETRTFFKDWQVLHIAGEGHEAEMQAAYQQAGIRTSVVPFCQQMGNAWKAADLAISRAGASSVAEVHANAVPTIFLPYPYHKDQHQRLNAQPLVEQGGALLMGDAIDPAANLTRIKPILKKLLTDQALRNRMRDDLRATCPVDGAQRIADWILAAT